MTSFHWKLHPMCYIFECLPFKKHLNLFWINCLILSIEIIACFKVSWWWSRGVYKVSLELLLKCYLSGLSIECQVFSKISLLWLVEIQTFPRPMWALGMVQLISSSAIFYLFLWTNLVESQAIPVQISIEPDFTTTMEIRKAISLHESLLIHSQPWDLSVLVSLMSHLSSHMRTQVSQSNRWDILVC